MCRPRTCALQGAGRVAPGGPAPQGSDGVGWGAVGQTRTFGHCDSADVVRHEGRSLSPSPLFPHEELIRDLANELTALHLSSKTAGLRSRVCPRQESVCPPSAEGLARVAVPRPLPVPPAARCPASRAPATPLARAASEQEVQSLGLPMSLPGFSAGVTVLPSAQQEGETKTSEFFCDEFSLPLRVLSQQAA